MRFEEQQVDKIIVDYKEIVEAAVPELPEDEFKLSINPPVQWEDILPKAQKKRRREHKLQEKLVKQRKE